MNSTWLSTRTENYDRPTADVAFSTVRRGRGVPADFAVRELADPSAGAFLFCRAGARLVALAGRVSLGNVIFTSCRRSRPLGDHHGVARQESYVSERGSVCPPPASGDTRPRSLSSRVPPDCKIVTIGSHKVIKSSPGVTTATVMKLTHGHERSSVRPVRVTPVADPSDVDLAFTLVNAIEHPIVTSLHRPLIIHRWVELFAHTMGICRQWPSNQLVHRHSYPNRHLFGHRPPSLG